MNTTEYSHLPIPFPTKWTIDAKVLLKSCSEKYYIYPEVSNTLKYKKNYKLKGKFVCSIIIIMSSIVIPHYELFHHNL